MGKYHRAIPGERVHAGLKAVCDSFEKQLSQPAVSFLCEMLAVARRDLYTEGSVYEVAKMPVCNLFVKRLYVKGILH